jgi:hypothetical protein
MQWPFELHSAGVSFNPADDALNRFDTIESYPDTLANRRPFYKFDFAALAGGIENSDLKTMRARAPKPDLGIQSLSVRAPRISWINCIGSHAREDTRECHPVEA